MPRLTVEQPMRVSGEITVTLRDVRRWHPRHWLPRVIRRRNLITNAGRTKFANMLIGATSDSINYLELGTGTTTPAAADTALTTPNATTWKSIGSRSVYASYYAEYDCTYATSEAVGSWEEMGLWAGATATDGTGTLCAHVLATWSKSSSQTATVTWRILVGV